MSELEKVLLEHLKDKEKGEIKITIDSWKDKDSSAIDSIEDISEFILIARQGTQMITKANCSKIFLIMAQEKIKDSL